MGENSPILKSNVLEPVERCFSFWYHIEGRETLSREPSIEIGLRKLGEEDTMRIWNHTKTVFADWVYDQVTIYKKSYHYSITVTAISDYGMAGIIAVDDLKNNRR